MKKRTNVISGTVQATPIKFAVKIVRPKGLKVENVFSFNYDVYVHHRTKTCSFSLSRLNHRRNMTVRFL